MQRLAIILACACGFLLCAQAAAQTNAAPVTFAAGAAQPRAVDADTPAKQAEVPVTGDVPAAVTAPGAPITQTAPMVPTEAITTTAAATPVDPMTPSVARKRGAFEADPDAYSVISAGSGLSLHKPMYVLPATYSEEYHGKKTELMFQISLKQRLFGIPLYVGYTQKSFWQAYNQKRSTPFRETDYNPELFYRFIPADRERWYHLGADFGFEHESNGKDLPDSRSWNRIYFAPFQAAGEHIIYWKWWWRLPEDKSKPRTDPDRDDNPDIGSFYGYSELHYEQQMFGKQLASLMLRWNPATGHASANLTYTIPNNKNDPSFFWMIYLFQGYGEDLLNYNHSQFRIGVGVALAR
ncbi:MAG: hypothetical protein JWR16_1184 [Nevskia sp.]|nr:hypothetical protein [Nevskia sp.]